MLYQDPITTTTFLSPSFMFGLLLLFPSEGEKDLSPLSRSFGPRNQNHLLEYVSRPFFVLVLFCRRMEQRQMSGCFLLPPLPSQASCSLLVGPEDLGLAGSLASCWRGYGRKSPQIPPYHHLQSVEELTFPFPVSVSECSCFNAILRARSTTMFGLILTVAWVRIGP